MKFKDWWKKQKYLKKGLIIGFFVGFFMLVSGSLNLLRNSSLVLIYKIINIVPINTIQWLADLISKNTYDRFAFSLIISVPVFISYYLLLGFLVSWLISKIKSSRMEMVHYILIGTVLGVINFLIVTLIDVFGFSLFYGYTNFVFSLTMMLCNLILPGLDSMGLLFVSWVLILPLSILFFIILSLVLHLIIIRIGNLK